MSKRFTHKLLTVFIASVWIVNGLFCKVLNLVPRHAEIVAIILSLQKSVANNITILIGFAEIIMALWVLSGYKSKLNAFAQIIIVAIMNSLEFIIVPDLLLWGKFNSLFAFIFILLVYFNEFVLNKNKHNAVIS
jgi:hypothetical protein